MVEQKVIEDMVDFMLKLSKEFDKREYPLFCQLNILGNFVFLQFNGTRNDTDAMFKKIIKSLETKKEK